MTVAIDTDDASFRFGWFTCESLSIVSKVLLAILFGRIKRLDLSLPFTMVREVLFRHTIIRKWLVYTVVSTMDAAAVRLVQRQTTLLQEWPVTLVGSELHILGVRVLLLGLLCSCRCILHYLADCSYRKVRRIVRGSPRRPTHAIVGQDLEEFQLVQALRDWQCTKVLLAVDSGSICRYGIAKGLDKTLVSTGVRAEALFNGITMFHELLDPALFDFHGAKASLLELQTCLCLRCCCNLVICDRGSLSARSIAVDNAVWHAVARHRQAASDA